jgi:c(7)-type cytochrome triheme protein
MHARGWRRFIPGRVGADTPAQRQLQLWLAVLLLLVSAVALAATGQWLSIAADGVHDPGGPAIGVLQEPQEALAALPHDTAGNKVRWVQALDQGQIQPRSNIRPETRVNLRTTDVLLKNTSDKPMVRFPHRQHTLWLDCSNCHDQLFAQVAGGTRIGMFLILQGEKCGLCHGAVSFPLTECDRCHSVKRGSPEHLEFGNSLVLDRGAR